MGAVGRSHDDLSGGQWCNYEGNPSVQTIERLTVREGHNRCALSPIGGRAGRIMREEVAGRE
eukprot:scaffold12880_cov155-Skeletonema_dohrnii-CCMP3373.AAC.2